MKKNSTHTWKIGEYCKGGIITVEMKRTTENLEVAIIGKDWDYSKGTRKSSDQKNAKEFDRHTEKLSLEPFGSFWQQYQRMEQFLWDLTTPYYADQVMTWIKTQVKTVTQK